MLTDNDMTKKIILNGIELSLPKYNASAVTIFDYLEDVVSNLENELGKDDGSFQISINMDFSTNKPLHYKIHSNNGSTKKGTKDRVAKALTRTNPENLNRVSGSVKVNLLVEDR